MPHEQVEEHQAKGSGGTFCIPLTCLVHPHGSQPWEEEFSASWGRESERGFFFTWWMGPALYWFFYTSWFLSRPDWQTGQKKNSHPNLSKILHNLISVEAKLHLQSSSGVSGSPDIWPFHSSALWPHRAGTSPSFFCVFRLALLWERNCFSLCICTQGMCVYIYSESS